MIQLQGGRALRRPADAAARTRRLRAYYVEVRGIEFCVFSKIAIFAERATWEESWQGMHIRGGMWPTPEMELHFHHHLFGRHMWVSSGNG